MSADEIVKHHAREWERCIINAGGDENVAQQAVTLAALSGLFDIHKDWGAEICPRCGSNQRRAETAIDF